MKTTPIVQRWFASYFICVQIFQLEQMLIQGYLKFNYILPCPGKEKNIAICQTTEKRGKKMSSI